MLFLSKSTFHNSILFKYLHRLTQDLELYSHPTHSFNRSWWPLSYKLFYLNTFFCVMNKLIKIYLSESYNKKISK